MHHFSPVVMDKLGVWGPEATFLIRKLRRRTAALRDKLKAAAFLRERIDIAFQWGSQLQ